MLNEIDKIYKLKSEISVLLIMVLSPIYFVSDFLLRIFKIKYYNPKLYEKLLDRLMKKWVIAELKI